jgi:hypothetical protein
VNIVYCKQCQKEVYSISSSPVITVTRLFSSELEFHIGSFRSRVTKLPRNVYQRSVLADYIVLLTDFKLTVTFS